MAVRLWEFESPRRHQDSQARIAGRGQPGRIAVRPCSKSIFRSCCSSSSGSRRHRPAIARTPCSPAQPRPRKAVAVRVRLRSFEDARMKFDVRYYLVAILFILFDLEIAFLSRGPSCCATSALFGFWSMMLFLAILIVGFIYEWKKGALDWEYSSERRTDRLRKHGHEGVLEKGFVTTSARQRASTGRATDRCGR